MVIVLVDVLVGAVDALVSMSFVAVNGMIAISTLIMNTS